MARYLHRYSFFNYFVSLSCNRMAKTVCVVGAGVSGLVSVKQCLEEGLEPICFEKDGDVGGLWNYHDEPRDGYPSVYNSCRINNRKEMVCYSDFPIPKDFRTSWATDILNDTCNCTPNTLV